MRNYVSYVAVEDAVYLGLRGIIRKFRKRLGLPKLRAGEGQSSSSSCVTANLLVDTLKNLSIFCP